MLNAAIAVARRSPHRFALHAAIIYRGGAIISTGYNHGTVHAEKSALSKIWPNKRVGCRLLSIRITKTGLLRMALPCEECMALIKESGIRVIDYSTENGEIKRLKL